MNSADNVQRALQPDFASQHGCVWFDMSRHDHKDPRRSPGWWSVGGQASQTFESWKDLPEGVTWWTNLTKAESWSLGRWQHFKEACLFGPDWPSLMTDGGQGSQHELIAQGVAAWSETFARCAFWLTRWAREHHPDQPWEWGEGVLSEVIKQRMGWGGQEPAEPQPIFAAAYCQEILQEVPANMLTRRRKITLAFPRLDHARQIWSQRYPIGEWQPVEKMPHDAEQKLQWVREHAKPLLLRVDDIEWRLNKATQGSLWLGMRGRRFIAAEMEPVWMTGEEVSRLSEFGIPKISEAYVGSQWERAAPVVGWAVENQTDPLLNLSWSQGLLGTSLWHAAGSPMRDPRRRNRYWITPRSIWWHAQDRDRCFRAAQYLQQKGWPILSYGQGHVTILFDPEEQASPLIQAIAETGLLMPAVLAKMMTLPPRISFEKNAEVDSWLKHHMGARAFLDIDRIVSPWPGPMSDIKVLLEGAAGRLVKVPAPNEAWAQWWPQQLKAQARLSVDRIKADKSRV